jgi:hypothetical protein
MVISPDLFPVSKGKSTHVVLVPGITKKAIDTCPPDCMALPSRQACSVVSSDPLVIIFNIIGAANFRPEYGEC